MHDSRFDDITRLLGDCTRRSLVALSLGGIATFLARSGARGQATPETAAGSTAPATPTGSTSVCDNPDTTGLQDRAPGELVAYEEITPSDDPTFPAEARAWRVLYVSTGRDNSERALVCGVVVAPDAPSRIFTQADAAGSRGRVVAWCHGTLGMIHRCQPSAQPASEIWGPTPYGINQVAWGSETTHDQHLGTPEDGILAGIIDAGWVVAASDYFVGLGGSDALHPWIVGKIEAANTIDNIRAAHRLLMGVYDGYDVCGYDVVTWGHSQGGHAALWTGQLLESYASATATSSDPNLALSGVALEAPASNMVVQPAEQSDTAEGFGLFDWLANGQLAVDGVPNPLPGAPFFSYLFGPWAQFSKSGSPDPEQMPAYPDVGALDITVVVEPEAIETTDAVNQLCWTAEDGARLVELITPYGDKPFLQPTISHGEVIDGFEHGNFDATCAGEPTPALANWCAWLRYNLPGPLGKHPLSKLPRHGDRLVPVMIANGSADTVVRCVAPQDAQNTVPSARDCMSVALYDALRAEYCPEGNANGHLALMIWKPEEGVTAADHSAIAALPGAASTAQPTFAGSPLQQFFVAAFEGTLEPGCSASVVNAS